MSDPFADIRDRATISVDEALPLPQPISKAAIYRGCESGEIPSIRVGRRVLIPVAPLLRLLGDAE